MNDNHKGIDKIDIALEMQEGIPIIKLSGSFSGEVAYDVFDHAKENLFAKGKYSLILDMNNLKKFLSRGIAVIIELCSQISENNGRIVLVCENDMFCTILNECDIKRLADVVPNLEEALEIMRK